MNTRTNNKPVILSWCVVVALYVAVFVAEQFLPPTSMLFTVLKKGATYALVAVSMNLLNGFTGIFSLGQAGFMLIGAYVFGIFTIPVAQRAQVYQYFNGGLVQFTVPVVMAMVMSGLAAAFFALLIGLPVLRLKSDYLAIDPGLRGDHPRDLPVERPRPGHQRLQHAAPLPDLQRL